MTSLLTSWRSMTHTPVYNRAVGLCPVCEKSTLVRRDGLLISHYPAASFTRDECLGSRLNPVADKDKRHLGVSK